MSLRTFVLAVCTLLALAASPSATAFLPVTGHWWNPNESGTGYNIDVYGSVLVITVYSYKTGGDSEWYLASGPMSADRRHFTGTLDKYRNGQCISCPYAGRPALVGDDGTISIQFASESSATLSLPGGRVTVIQPFFPADDRGLDGSYRLRRSTINFVGGPLYDTAIGNFSASGTMVIAGGRFTQTVTVTVGGTTLSDTESGTLTDHGVYVFVVQNGASGQVPVIQRAPFFMTESVGWASDDVPPASEVDQWEFVSAASVETRGANPAAGETGARFGTLVSVALGVIAPASR